MSQTSTIHVEETMEKSGERNGKPWTRYALKDGNGNWYSTFVAGVVTESLKGQKVDVEWEQNGDYKDLLRASPHEESPIASRQDDGSADWDLIGLRKTRCALWAAFLPGALEAGFGAWMQAQSTEPGTADIVHFLQRFGKQLILGAEVDIFHRAPAVRDEDVPF